MTDTLTPNPAAASEAHEALAELQRRILDGDTSITAAALAKARDAADLATLHAAADQRAIERQHALDLAARQDRARADIATAQARLDTARSTYGELVDLLARLGVEHNAYQRARQAAMAAARGSGIEDEARALAELRQLPVYIDRAVREGRGSYTTSGGHSSSTAPHVTAHGLMPRSMIERINRDLAARHADRAAHGPNGADPGDSDLLSPGSASDGDDMQ